MNIKLCSNKTEYFNNIEIGGVFMYHNGAYMKTDARYDINAVNLYDGRLTYIIPNETVNVIKGSFVEEGLEGEI